MGRIESGSFNVGTLLIKWPEKVFGKWRHCDVCIVKSEHIVLVFPLLTLNEEMFAGNTGNHGLGKIPDSWIVTQQLEINLPWIV